MKTTVAKPEASAVHQFAALVKEGIRMWSEAGRLLVEMTDKDPDFPKKIRTAHPGISQDILTAFERIGRKQLHPLLLSDNSPGARHLSSTPFATQEKYLNERLPVVVQNGAAFRTDHLAVSELTPAQVRQVFHQNVVRTPEQQIAHLKFMAGERTVPRATTTAPATSAKVRGITRLGCYTVKVARNGTVTLTPTKESYAAQQVRVVRPPGSPGDFAGDVLFFTHE